MRHVGIRHRPMITRPLISARVAGLYVPVEMTPGGQLNARVIRDVIKQLSTRFGPALATHHVNYRSVVGR